MSTYVKAFREIADQLRTIVGELDVEKDYVQETLQQGVGRIEVLVELLEAEDE